MNRIRLSTAWGAAALLFATACRPPSARVPPAEKRFFDVKGFMQAEAARLAAGSFVLVKAVDAGGNQEAKRLDTPDWNGELQPFADCDINALAGTNAYRADTTATAAGIAVAYTAIDKRVKVQSLAVRWRGDAVASLTAVRRTANPYYVSETTLRYVPDSGFAIRGYQKIVFKDADRLHIGARFVAPGGGVDKPAGDSAPSS